MTTQSPVKTFAFTWLYVILSSGKFDIICLIEWVSFGLTGFHFSKTMTLLFWHLFTFVHFYYQRVIGYKQVQIVLGRVEFSHVSHWLFFFNLFYTPKQTNSIPSASVQVRYLFIFSFNDLFFFLVKMKETLTISMHHRRTSTYLSTSRAYVPLVHKFAPEREPKENCTSWWNEG